MTIILEWIEEYKALISHYMYDNFKFKKYNLESMSMNIKQLSRVIRKSTGKFNAFDMQKFECTRIR